MLIKILVVLWKNHKNKNIFKSFLKRGFIQYLFVNIFLIYKYYFINYCIILLLSNLSN